MWQRLVCCQAQVVISFEPAPHSLPSRAQRLHSTFSGLQLEYSRYTLTPSQPLSSSPQHPPHLSPSLPPPNTRPISAPLFLPPTPAPSQPLSSSPQHQPHPLSSSPQHQPHLSSSLPLPLFVMNIVRQHNGLINRLLAIN